MIIGRAEVIMAYEYYYSKKYGNSKYIFKPSPQAYIKIDLFLSSLDKIYKLYTLGHVFLSRYFSFQFNRLEGQTFQRFASKSGVAGKIQIYDIIGKKSIEYFEKRDTKYDFTLSEHIFDMHIIELPELNKSEEIHKARFLNTEWGLPNCLDNTSLFNHLSSNCVICNARDSCKKILQLNFPKIYSDRKYGTTIR